MRKKLAYISVFLLMFSSVFYNTIEAKSINKSTEIGNVHHLLSETPEIYEIETYTDVPNEEGIYELTGTKRVIANTFIEERGKTINFILHIKEDYYDLDGQFLKTELSYEEMKNDYSTGEAVEASVNKTLDSEESNILDQQLFSLKSINKSEQSKVIKESIEKELMTNDLEYNPTEGITYDEINRIDEYVTSEIVNPTAITESAGAFNNYYNRSGSNFTAQVLGSGPNKYIKVTGSYYDNVSGYSKFRGYINNYESNVIQSMNYASNTIEVSKWVNGIASFVRISTTVAGTVLSGPSGWATALSYISTASLFGKFSAWTSTAYATYARLDFSQAAAKNQVNALSMMNDTNWPNVTWSFPTIN